MCCHLINMITSLGEWCDGLDPSVSLALWSFSLLLLLSSWLIHVPMTMRLRDSRIPEEHLVCYQTSQHNWAIIKMLCRCLRWCLLSWHRLRLGFVTPCIKRYLWALSVMHITISLASNVTNELVAGWCITERVKRLAGNEIELGMMIPTIESRASNIPMTKGTTCCYAVWPIKIFIEYVGTNMDIQVPLLVIDYRGVSVMST